MNKHVFTVAFLLGALGIVWSGAGFITSERPSNLFVQRFLRALR